MGQAIIELAVPTRRKCVYRRRRGSDVVSWEGSLRRRLAGVEENPVKGFSGDFLAGGPLLYVLLRASRLARRDEARDRIRGREDGKRRSDQNRIVASPRKSMVK